MPLVMKTCHVNLRYSFDDHMKDIQAKNTKLRPKLYVAKDSIGHIGLAFILLHNTNKSHF